jgi:ribonuclease BN (tRNA processing enzyme)
VLEQVEKRAKEDAAKGNSFSIARHVADTHSSPAVVARMASEANVKTVVLYHQVGGASGSLSFPATGFIDAIHAAGFGGEVIVGQDLMVL